ncbi:hypothetical protein WJX84_006693 [Apatococcus fuscideae]|uniref:Uncharacterized protein n=1 Tax=Apatococcus fuscideae TaxID=2026836 RepID=A0AAW1TCP1_9CHLO
MDAEGPGGASSSDRDSSAAEQPVVVSWVACGSSHSLALLSSDIALSWGRGEDGQLGHGDADERKEPEAIYGLLNEGVTSVHSGAEYSLACCRQRKEVFSWGWGDFGRLGHGDARDVFIPRAIPGLSGKSVRDVACGDTHTLVSTFDGELWGFGRNQNGQLGLGHIDDAFAPQCVTDLKIEPTVSPALQQSIQNVIPGVG